jgi:hypothetical protein
MALFGGRRAVPADVRPHLGLERGERVLATARLDDGGIAVATDRLLLVADARARRWALPWYQVDAAGWDDGERRLEVDLVDGGRQRLLLAGDERTLLPEVVRERVQWSIVLTQHVQAGHRRAVRVVVRRGPDELIVQVVPDPGVDLEDPAVAEAVRRARAEVEQAVGLDQPD